MTPRQFSEYLDVLDQIRDSHENGQLNQFETMEHLMSAVTCLKSEWDSQAQSIVRMKRERDANTEEQLQEEEVKEG